jgi:hypothetical protein
MDETELTLEQQFDLCSFSLQVQQLNHEQSQELLIKLYETILVREAMYKNILKHEWNLEDSSLKLENK